MRFVVLLAALAASSAVPAAASPSQPNGFVTLPHPPVAPQDAVTQMYRDGPRDTPRQALARLNRWCESKRSADQRRCEAAWGRINAEYARMQAERAETN